MHRIQARFDKRQREIQQKQEITGMSNSAPTFKQLHRQLRQDLPMTKEIAYFQTGGHGPTPDSVLKVFYDNMLYLNHNVLAVPETREVMDTRENAVREQLAAFLNVKSDELAFTANTSRGEHRILHSMRWRPGDEFIVSSMEHVSIQSACQALERHYDVIVKVIPADQGDEALLEALSDALTERTRLVCLSQATTMEGRRLPVAEAGRIAHDRDVLMMVDGAQSVGQYPVDVAELDCDFFVGSGHKWLLGPMGLSFIWVAPERIPDFRPDFISDYSPWLKPGDPRPPITAATRVEQGTHDFAIRIALGRALDIITGLGVDRIEAHAQRLAGILFQEVAEWNGVNIVTPIEPGRASGLLALTFDGYDEPKLRELISKLMEERLVVKFQPELTAMRISIACFNSEDEVHRLLETLKRFLYA
jgi:selenocysteine lyase/cysteine desulfurase